MPKAAIYVRDPLAPGGALISADDQETACRDYCQARDFSVKAAFRDTPGNRDEFTRMISQATQDDSSLHFIVVWKLQMFSRSFEETIEMRGKLRQVGTKLVSATEKGIDDDPTAVTPGAGSS